MYWVSGLGTWLVVTSPGGRSSPASAGDSLRSVDVDMGALSSGSGAGGVADTQKVGCLPCSGLARVNMWSTPAREQRTSIVLTNSSSAPGHSDSTTFHTETSML
jgi:hypothetical protein